MRGGFGHQLAYDERQVGDDDHRSGHGQLGGVGLGAGDEAEQRLNVVGNVGATVGTGDDAYQRDAYLDGGQVFFGVFQLLQHRLGSLVAFADEGFQPGFVGRHQGHFIHGKDAVEDD